MTDEANDEDLKEVANELGRALSVAIPGATKAEVQSVINAIDDLIQVRIARFAEVAADRFEASTRKLP